MKFPKLLLVIAVLGSSALSLSAQTTANPSQQKTIKKQDFEKIEKKAKQLLATLAYRVTKTEEESSKKDGEFRIWHKTIEEYVPPDRSHILSAYTLDDGKSWTNEYITIGKRKFERKNKDPWKKPSESHFPFGNIVSEFSTQYFEDLPVLVDGKTVNVYVVVKKSKIRGGTIPPFEMTCRINFTYWYDSDGRPLKRVGESECKEAKLPSSYDRETDIYEYDSTIKIEAPK
jgi:hypothetical protein